MRNGFVLLEVLVALMVAAIMLTALFGAQSLVLRAELRATMELPLRCGMYWAWLDRLDSEIASTPPASIVFSDELLPPEEGAYPMGLQVWSMHHPAAAERVVSLCLAAAAP